MLRYYTLADVAAHNKREDAWIVVDGKVYDITDFINNHPGWESGAGISVIIAILGALGTDCSEDFQDIHSETAKKQLPQYFIGLLKTD